MKLCCKYFPYFFCRNYGLITGKPSYCSILLNITTLIPKNPNQMMAYSPKKIFVFLLVGSDCMAFTPHWTGETCWGDETTASQYTEVQCSAVQCNAV